MCDRNAYLIVSRHAATVAYVREALPEYAEAPVLAVASVEDVRGKHVAGNLPLHLAAEAEAVDAVEFAGTPPRGAEYGLAEMQAAGVRTRRYFVFTPASYARALASSGRPRSPGRTSGLGCVVGQVTEPKPPGGCNKGLE